MSRTFEAKKIRKRLQRQFSSKLFKIFGSITIMTLYGDDNLLTKRCLVFNINTAHQSGVEKLRRLTGEFYQQLHLYTVTSSEKTSR